MDSSRGLIAAIDESREFLHRHHLTTHLALAILFALLSSLAFAGAMVAQQRAAARVPDERRPGQLVRELVRSPEWLAGTAASTLGYALQATALAFGTVVVVAPLLMTSLLFALPWGGRLAGRRLPRSSWESGGVLAVALAVFVSTGNPRNGVPNGTRHDWFLAALVGAQVVLGCLIAAGRTRGASRASLLAITVGLLAGALAVLTKGLTFDLTHGGISRAATSWEFFAWLVVGGLGVYLQQHAFQAGALQASMPIITVLEPLCAVALGIAVLHERLQVGPARLGLLILAATVMALATIALARGEAYVEERH